MTKFAIVFSVCVLSVFVTVSEGGLYLEIVDGQLVCGDGEIVMLNASQFNLGNILYGGFTIPEGITTPVPIHVTPICVDTEPVVAPAGIIYPFFPTIDNFDIFNTWPQTIELQPLDSFPGTIPFDPALNPFYGSFPDEPVYVVVVPEPASLVLFGIGGLLISKRRSK